jgi:flagellar biosynthesis protein FlhF
MSDERRYRGRSPGEAMRRAREELGLEARLVSARRITPPGQAPLYEVRVTPGPPRRAPEDPAVADLRRQVDELRATLQAFAAAAAPAAGAPRPEAATLPPAPPAPVEPDPLATLLRRRGMGEELARTLATQARASGGRDDAARLHAAVASALASTVPPERLGERSVVVVGPAGGGKTTTLAKIAAEAAARGGRPVLVCADGESLGGEDALAAVAEALSLPLETAFLDGALEGVIERRGAGATYLVDTPGRTPDEVGALDSLRRLVDALPDAEVVLVAPLATEDEELRRLVEGFAPLGLEKVVLTRLDEIARPGRLVELARSLPRPVAWVTFGRAARGAGSTPDDPRVLARILGTGLAVERTA